MRTLKAGLALAIVGGVLLAPLSAAGRRQNGLISGSAIAEVKKDDRGTYARYIVRARDVATNNIVQTTTLDANALYALNGLAAGSFIVELVRDAAAGGQGGKIVCQEGPFNLREQAGQAAESMMIRDADIKCNNPAAWWLLGAAAAAGITAGIVAGGDPVSGAQ
jgi:hypothetical protein